MKTKSKQNAVKDRTAKEGGLHKADILTLPSKGKRVDAKVSGHSNAKAKGNRIVVAPFSEQWTTPVAGAGGYTVGNVYPNPGDSSVFSRLSSLAACYTEYRYKRFKLKYLPLGSAYATNNNSGEVVLAAVGNFYTAAPASMQGARAITPNAVGDAWTEIELDVSKDILNRWRKVRSNVATSGSDANTFDFVLMVCVQATNNTNSIGYLLFDGEVEFRGDYYQNVAFPPRTNQIWSMWQPNAQSLAVSGTTYTMSTSSASICYGNALTGVVLQSNTFYLYGGTYVVMVRARVSANSGTATTMLMAGVTGAYFSNQTAVFTSVQSFSALTLVDQYTVAVVEDGVPATFYMSIRLDGASALSLDSWEITIIALG